MIKEFKKQIIDLFLNEEEYYKFYMGQIKAIIISNLVIETWGGVKPLDEAVIHCRYKSGKIDDGRHISPIYKTILFIQKDIEGLDKDYTLIHLKN